MAAHRSWPESCLPLAMVTLLGVICPCVGFASGPPSDACMNMTPNHRAAPQQSLSPFGISVNASSYRPGQTLTVRLSSTDGRPFKGFLIKAVSAENGTDQNQALGTFSTSNETKILCSSTQGSGLSHSVSSDKFGLDLEWTAPSSGQGNITFKATFVQTMSTYWVAVPFPSLLTQAEVSSESTAATSDSTTNTTPVTPTAPPPSVTMTTTSQMTPRPSSNTSFLLLAVSSPAAMVLMDAESGRSSRLPVTNLNIPVAIDWDPVENEVYWTDVGRKEIRRYKLDSGRDEVVLKLNDVAVPDGIAVDALSRLVIYTDTGNDVIAMVSMQGGYRKTILQQGLQQPRAVVVDPEQSLLYYTDWGSQPHIASLTYDGVRVTLVSTGLGWPNGLALDKQGDWLYWVDASLDRVEAVRTQGGDRRVLRTQPGKHHFDLTLLHGTLFLTDWLHSSVQTMDTIGGNVSYLGPALDGRKNGIQAFSTRATSGGVSPCYGWIRGGCSHVCVVRNSTATCQCADGFSLQSDGYTCIQGETTPTITPSTSPRSTSSPPETTPWWSSIQSTTTTPRWWSNQTADTTPFGVSTTMGFSTTTTPPVMSTPVMATPVMSTAMGFSTTTTPPVMATPVMSTPTGFSTTTTPPVMATPVMSTTRGFSTTTTPPVMATPVMSTATGFSTTTTSGLTTMTTMTTMTTTMTTTGMTTTTTTPSPSTTEGAVSEVIKPAPDTSSYVYLPCCMMQWGFFPCLASDGSQIFVVC